LRASLNDTHFEVLGVTRNSTKDEIKKAFREQIKKWHPDKFPNQPDKISEALERSKKINEAFSFLENYEPPKQTHTNFNSYTYGRPKERADHSRTTAKPKASRLNIERIRVKSSNIHSIGYDREAKVLQVEFLNGSVYQYCNVPEFVYQELMQASSKGKFFNSKIAFSYKYDCV
jgi:hypothetical protein